MDTHYYYKSIRNTIIMFLDIFNSIKIAKYDKQGNVLKYVTVPVKFAPKEKAYMWVHDKKSEKVLPLIAVELRGLSYDSSRTVNKNLEIPTNLTSTDELINMVSNPVPYNFDFAVHIISHTIVEVDQILEQTLTYFNPNVFIKLKVPEYDNLGLDLRVIFKSAQPSFLINQGDKDYRWIEWVLNFTVNGYLFRPVKEAYATKKMVREYWLSDDAWENRTFDDPFLSGGPGADYQLSSFTEVDLTGRTLMTYEVFETETEE